MRLTDVLRDIGRPVVFYPSLNDIVGGMAANVLLTQLLYWQGKGMDPDGWIYKSRTEILHETGLGRDSQETARRELRLRGFLQEKFGDMPRRLLFRLNLDAINDSWEEAIYQHKVETHPTVDAACLLHKVEKHPARRVESTQQEGGKAPSKKGGFPPAYTESTTEITTEKKDTTPFLPTGESDEPFEQFWKAYPRKQKKGNARRAWEKIKPAASLVEKILLAVQQQRQSSQWTKDSGQFIPLPASWLNGEQWLDETDTATDVGVDPNGYLAQMAKRLTEEEEAERIKRNARY
jgi:hypothetical protein